MLPHRRTPSLANTKSARAAFATDTPFGTGFPRPGANGTVDVASPGLTVGNFTYRAGPVMRFVCEMTPTGPRARNVLPGGETFNTTSPHYRDLIEQWRRNQTFDVAFREGPRAWPVCWCS